MNDTERVRARPGKKQRSNGASPLRSLAPERTGDRPSAVRPEANGDGRCGVGESASDGNAARRDDLHFFACVGSVEAA
jgi:hypothetical protein